MAGQVEEEEEEAIVPFTGASCPNRGGHIGLPCTVAQETSLSKCDAQRESWNPRLKPHVMKHIKVTAL